MKTSKDQTRLISREDQRFLLFDWLDLPALLERERYAGQTREAYEDVLDLAERLAADAFAPHNRAADIDEPRLEDGRVVVPPGIEEALSAYAEAGFFGLTQDEELGGMRLPLLLSTAVSAWFHAANTGATAYALLTGAAANLIAASAGPEQAQRFVPPMVEGRFFGTMCLSEPQAGSSLADITTKAEPQGDDVYRIFGSKMWISGGEHELAENIVHMVLAQVPGAGEGVAGLGLFIVPRFLLDDSGLPGEANDVTLAGLNHKMGYRGTVNTVLNFGEGTHLPGGRAGAVGYLVGEVGRGLSYMFRMMNEARIAVGVVATGLGYTGYLKSLDYARERPQGRPRIARDISSPQVPIIEHADVRRMLLAQKSYVEGALALVLFCSRLNDDVESLSAGPDRERARLLLDILTPLAKSWPSQWCLEANSLAIQVHGGYGYSREYDVEQHYRDNRLNLIHEGTHGIQALDLMGRKITMQGGAAGRELLAFLRGCLPPGEDVDKDLRWMGTRLAALLDRWQAVTEAAVESGPDEITLANATAYMEATGHIVVAALWGSQLRACEGRDGDFYAGKRQAARYFFKYELPRAETLLDLVQEADDTPLQMRDEWF